MFWNPARMISTKNGVHCQTIRMTMVRREWTPKKSNGLTPNRMAKYPFQPKEELRMMVRHTIPATASITKNGEMIRVRTIFTPGKSRFSMRPKRIPRTVQTARETTVITTVLRTTS